MQFVSRLKTFEQRVERDVLAVFRLIGASEAPEEWASERPAPAARQAQTTPAPSESRSK